MEQSKKDQFKQKLQLFIQQNKTSYVNLLRNNKNNKFDEYIKNINTLTPKLQDYNYSYSTKCYWILNDISDFPKCEVCGNVFGVNKNISLYTGYGSTCSNRCKTILCNPKRKQTSLQKYGVDNPMKSTKIKNKKDENNIVKYGSPHPNQFTNEQMNEKYKQNCIKKYGVDDIKKNSDVVENIRKKIKETNLQKYGVECVLQNKEIRAKVKQTFLDKYGVDNPNKLKSVRNKIKETNLQRYGVDIPTKSDKIKNKVKQTFLNRYGVIAPSQNINIRKKMIFTKAKNFFYNNICKQSNVVPLFNFDEYFEHYYDKFYLFKWKCNDCNTVFENFINENWFKTHKRYSRCLKCYPLLAGYSNGEMEIYNFIKTVYNGNIEQHNRNLIKPFELDIYIPDKNIAFEFNGVFWHSEKCGTHPDYHVFKTEQCLNHNIQLIHIFENEWVTKQDIVKSRIKNLLGAYDVVVYARKCILREVSNKEAQLFLNDNHIQGPAMSSINVGLFFNDEMVSLMTFSKSRLNKQYEYELLRFCNKLNYHIPGAAGKMFKYFELNYKPKSIITFADRRWSMGNVYEKLGFVLKNISKPNYWYWKDYRVLESRIKYQKFKLKKIFGDQFNPNLTEVENMINNGYNRIFDCGNLVFVKKYD